MTPQQAADAIDAVWRIESARLIAGLARIVGDVGLAEDLAQDALVAALEQWPRSGVPDNPGAWLMATAKHRAIDQLRRQKMQGRKHEHLGRELDERQVSPEPALAAAIDDHVGDDLLSLIFTACHPVLTTEARVSLTLRLLGGLTTDEIARAFLVPKATIQQRIVRAKRTLAAARVPFEVPRGAELAQRLESVLEVIYLVFNEGYSATAGDEWVRPALCEDAIAACHARARTAEETDWTRIVALYDALAQLMPSPIVDLNRAVALGMAFGPAAGLEVVDSLTTHPALASYHLLPSVRGDLLAKLGRFEEARAELKRAAELTQNARERGLLLKKLEAL